MHCASSALLKFVTLISYFMSHKKGIITILFLISLTFASCSFMSALTGYHFDHYDKVYLRDYSAKMESLRINFPEIYDLYKKGLIIINEMYEYKDKDGTPRVHVNYRYR